MHKNKFINGIFALKYFSTNWSAAFMSSLLVFNPNFKAKNYYEKFMNSDVLKLQILDLF